MKKADVNNSAHGIGANGRRAGQTEKAYRVAVVGGGAAGLFFAAKYGDADTLLLEKGDRVGRKLSATGGGWGNVTNLRAGTEYAGAEYAAESAAREGGNGGYFTLESGERGKIEQAVRKFPPESLRAFLLSLGCVTFADERGRVYPLSRQASSVTDCLRAEARRRGVNAVTGAEVTRIYRDDAVWKIVTPGGGYAAENVLLCTGGRAAKHFGSDGGGYALAQSIGHSVTETFPALVQIRCAEKEVRALKGIRVFDGEAGLYIGGAETARRRGDILFTDYGVSGDCAFKISSFLPPVGATEAKVVLSLDFLPDLPENTLKSVLASKKERYADAENGELFTGILNNRIGETLARRVRERQNGKNDGRNVISLLAKEAKSFTLTVTGTAGFDNAQVTKGGVRLAETDGNFQSVFAKNVYFAGEILDVDGACGGYNLQWAYSSACVAGEDMAKKSVTARV